MNGSVQYSIEVRRALGRVQEHVRNSSGCRKLGLHRVDVLRVLEYVGTLERTIAPSASEQLTPTYTTPEHLGDWAHPAIKAAAPEHQGYGGPSVADLVERSASLDTNDPRSASPNPAGQDPVTGPNPAGPGRVTNSMEPMPAGSRSTVETRFLDGVMVKLNGIPVWVSGVASTHPNNWTLVGEVKRDPNCHHASAPRDGDFARVSYALGSERTRTRIRQVLYDHADAVDRYRLGRSAAVLRGETTEAILNIIREEMENAGK